MSQWAFCKDNVVQWVSEIPSGLLPIAPPGFDVFELPQPLSPAPFDGAAYDIQSRAWIDARTAASKWADVRMRRDRLLQRSDWTGLSDAPMTGPARAQWAQYRQALRDITKQSDPDAIVWPEPPA